MQRWTQKTRMAETCVVLISFLSIPFALGTGAEPILLQGHQEVVYDSAFLPDGSSVVTASFDSTLKLWDLTTRQAVRTMEGHTGIILTVDVSPDGTQIASAGSDNTIKFWDVPKNIPLQTLPVHDSAGTAINVSADGKWFATGDQKGVVRVWNVETGKQTGEWKLSAGLTHLSWKRDAGLLTAVAGNTMYVLNPDDGATVAVVGVHTKEVTGLVFSPNNAQIYTSGADGLVKRWPVSFPAGVQLKGHTGPVNGISQHPNQTLIATAGQDGTARLFNAKDGAQKMVLDGHSGPVTAITFSPGGNRILTGSADGTARLFEAGGKPVTEFTGAAGPVVALAVSASAAQVIIADQTGQFRVLKAADGAEERKFAFGAAIRAAAVTANFSRAAAAHANLCESGTSLMARKR